MHDVQELPDGGYILLCSASGRVIYCSGSLQLLLGEDPTGRNLNDFLDDALSARIVARALNGESTDFFCALMRRSFSALAESVSGNISITLFPRNDQGAPAVWPHAVGMVARELNSALHTAFLALNELRPQLVGEGREDGAVLAQSLYRLLRLSHNLTSYSEAEQGLLRLHLTEEDAVRRCDELVVRLSELCRGQNIRLNWTPPEEPIVMRADWEKVERMLLNLIANAMAAQKQGGEITLTLTAQEDEVLMTVMDGGPGVPDPAHLFRKISTSDPSDPTTLGGAGIGLALTRALAALHGGQVLYSGGQDGTAFQIRLPRNPQGVLAPLSASRPGYTGGLDRVLVELSNVLGKDFF